MDRPAGRLCHLPPVQFFRSVIPVDDASAHPPDHHRIMGLSEQAGTPSKFRLGPLAFRDVAQDSCVPDFPIGKTLADGNLDGKVVALPAPPVHFPPETDEPHDAAGRIGGGFVPSFGKPCGEQHRDISSDHLFATIAKHVFGRRIARENESGMIERDDAVHRGFDELAIPLFAFAQAPFRLVLEESDLDLGRDIALLKRLENVPEGFSCGGAPQGGHVGMGGQIDDRDVPEGLNTFGGFDAVNGTGQPDVHQHEIRHQGLRRLHGVFTVAGDADRTVPCPFELAG